VIATHAIEMRYLSEDDFEGYFQARSKALLGLISSAMGKEPLATEGLTESPEQFVEEPIDPDDDLEIAEDVA
jgi:hypothetical protein